MTKIVIDAHNKPFLVDFREIVRYKDLFFTLALRDFKVRYAQTFLGFAWAFLQPFTTLVVLVIVFKNALKVDTQNVPYPLFAMAGMTLWTYFGYVLNQSGSSIISSQAMISKIYFPRLIIPISKAMVGIIDFGISFFMLICLFIYYQTPLQGQMVFLPLFVFINVISSLGAGILFSSLSVRFRDVQYIIPFIVQFGLYITPVAYPASFITSDFKFLYYLNPLAGTIDAFRWSLFGGELFSNYCYLSFTSGILLFIVSIMVFRSIENKMADIV